MTLRQLATALSLVATVVAASACEDPDCEFDDVDVAGRDVNPEGVAYPAGPYGATPRQGATPGDLFPNFTFQGYPSSSRHEGLQAISMADFYDPESRRHRVLLVTGAAMWCPYCANETEELAHVAPALRAEGAEFLQVIIDGPSRGEPPDPCLLDGWVDEYDTSFSVVLDVGGRRLGSVASLSSVPYNAIIDARTMEVIDAVHGAPADLPGWLRTWLSWSENNPR